MTTGLWFLVGYLAGSLPTSYLAGRIAGVDLRTVGSKNLGATNVYRVLGWSYAIPVGVVDVAKGAGPVFLTLQLSGDTEWVPLVAGLGAVMGHVFSVFLKFKGGKGVATAAGAVLALAPVPLGASAVTWIAVLLLTGYVSLASMLGALVFPLAVWVWMPTQVYTLWVAVALAFFIVYTHRANIRRLLTGSENRFRKRRPGVSEGDA
jgi:glycerol-3-phosphate acyltransferase PlsY